MIRAEHKRWAKWIFEPYIGNLLHKNFNNLYVSGKLPDLEKYPGLILTPNHFSWWDGFITYYLIRKLTPKNIYTMMLEEQLNKYWFFRKVGAFSINQSNPVSIVRTMDYTRDILKDDNNIVVLYPQGEIQSMFSDDIKLKPGLTLLLKKEGGGKYVLPLAMKIEYGNDKRPDIVCTFGRVFSAEEIRNDYEAYTREFDINLKRLKALTDFKNCRKLL